MKQGNMNIESTISQMAELLEDIVTLQGDHTKVLQTQNDINHLFRQVMGHQEKMLYGLAAIQILTIIALVLK